MAEWTSTVSFAGIEAAVAAAASRATQRIGEQWMEESLAILPTEDGDLARSGTVTTEQGPGASTTAAAFDTEYAVRQHEDLTLHHDGGETAKYLERPFVAASNGSAAAIAAEELGKAFR